MLEAEAQFRKIIGYRHLAGLALAVERDVATARATTTRSTTPPADTTTTTEPALRSRPHIDHRIATAKSTANGTTSQPRPFTVRPNRATPMAPTTAGCATCRRRHARADEADAQRASSATAAAIVCGFAGTGMPATSTVGVPPTPRSTASSVTKRTHGW